MKFRFQLLNGLEDAQANFEQIQSAFSPPVFAAAPPNPYEGQTYYNTTLHKLGYWNNTTWVYV